MGYAGILIQKKGLLRNIKGFTLGETLVTIAITGLIASITVPSMINSIEKRVLASQLKSTVSMFNQTLARINADNSNVPYCCCLYYDGGRQQQSCVYNPETQKYTCTLQDGSPEPSDNRWKLTECSQFYNALKRNLNIIKECGPGQGITQGCMPEYKSLEEVLRLKNPDITNDSLTQTVAGCSTWSENSFNTFIRSFVLENGVILFYYSYAYPAIDINGKRGPNKWGYDVFTLTLYGSKANGGTIKIVPSLNCIQSEPGGDDPKKIIRTY